MTLPVYYYHRVGPFRDGAPLKMNVSPDAFGEHMSVLARRANPVALDTLVECAREGKPFPGGAVAVTFDDFLKIPEPKKEEHKKPAAAPEAGGH
ncbi:MAG TPA: hypothetical protein VFC86_02980 [Planctomycetota bacterium]|nr:hypothetical protein [Planctomycetota bacterium]